jgi:vacuolar protein sorting-associated protein 13A/C
LVSPAVMWLDVRLASPIIVLPFKHDGSLSNEAWILNLGNLTVKTNPKILEKNLKPEEKMKDMFDIELTNIRMQYYPSL